MKLYLDSSAFAKRFVEEAGSDDVEQICANASALALSVISAPEVVSALNRRRRQGVLTASQYADAKVALAEELRDADIVELTPAVVSTAIHVLETSPVRTLDALHIASAVEWGAELFVSADHRQLDAADKAGLRSRRVRA